MADKRTDAALRDWRKSEERFADEFQVFLANAETAKLTKKTAIRISGLRADANSAMDTYLKRALK